MDAPHPAEAAHAADAAAALRHALPRLNTSKAINMWVEIRTFKALYSALRRVAGDIFLKYIDANSGAVELPADVRLRIREKAVLSADKTLSYDTFDEAREYVIHNLERELGAPERAAADLPPTIVFATPKKGHQKQREMFGFLSDGDETEDQQQLLRSERKKVAEMSEALAAWYGPDWESELRRRKKELKARAREEAKEKERLEDEERRERERRRKEEAFPGVPLHSEQDSLAKLKKRSVTTEVPPAFPGIPLYDERLRPRPESLRRLDTQRDAPAPPPPEAAADEAPVPPGKKEKERLDRAESREKDLRRNNAPLQREEEPAHAAKEVTTGSPPARGLSMPTKTISSPVEGALNAPPTGAATADENSAAAQISSPPRAGSGSASKLPALASSTAFPGIPLHFVEERPKERLRAKSLSPGGSTRDVVTQPAKPPDGKK